MSGLILERAAFATTMHAVGATSLIGLDLADLLPQSPAARRTVVEQGLAALRRCDLLVEGPASKPQIHPELLELCRVLANPEVAAVTVRVTSEGRQLFMHAVSGGHVVEHTLPDPDHHRLAVLPDEAALAHRIAAILPLGDVPVTPAVGRMETTALNQLLKHVRLGQHAEARALLAGCGLGLVERTDLLDALVTPVVRGTTALMRCVGAHVTAAFNPAFVQGSATGWLIAQERHGAPVLRVERANSAVARERLSEWLATLLPAPAGTR